MIICQSLTIKEFDSNSILFLFVVLLLIILLSGNSFEFDLFITVHHFLMWFTEFFHFVSFVQRVLEDTKKEVSLRRFMVV